MIRRFFFLMTFSVALLEGAAWGQDGCRLKAEAVQSFCGSDPSSSLGKVVKLGEEVKKLQDKIKDLEDKVSSDPSVQPELDAKKNEFKSQTKTLQGLVAQMDQAVMEQMPGCIDPQKQALKDALRQRAQGDGSNSQAGEDVLDSQQAVAGDVQATVAGNALGACGDNTFSAAGKFEACANTAGNVSRNLGNRQQGASSCGQSLLQQAMKELPEELKKKLVTWSKQVQTVEAEANRLNTLPVWGARPTQNYCTQSAVEARSTANACLNAANSMYQQAQRQPADDEHGEEKGGQGQQGGGQQPQQQGGGQQGGENQPSTAKAPTYPEEKAADSLSGALANSNKDKQDEKNTLATDDTAAICATVGTGTGVGSTGQAVKCVNGVVDSSTNGTASNSLVGSEDATTESNSSNSANGNQLASSSDTSSNNGLATGGRQLSSNDDSSSARSSRSLASSSSRGDSSGESASYSAIGSGGGSSFKSGSGTPIEGAKTEGNSLRAAFSKKANLDCNNRDSKYYKTPVCQRQRKAKAAVRAFSSSDEE